MIPPSTILRSALIASIKFTLPSTNGAWPLYVTTEPEKPNQCATLFDTTPVIDGVVQQTGEIMQHYGLQLRIRDPDYSTGWAKANDIRDLLPLLKQLTVVISGTSYFLEAAVVTSGVIPLGMDDKRRELFTLNFLVTVKEI